MSALFASAAQCSQKHLIACLLIQLIRAGSRRPHKGASLAPRASQTWTHVEQGKVFTKSAPRPIQSVSQSGKLCNKWYRCWQRTNHSQGDCPYNSSSSWYIQTQMKYYLLHIKYKLNIKFSITNTNTKIWTIWVALVHAVGLVYYPWKPS